MNREGLLISKDRRIDRDKLLKPVLRCLEEYFGINKDMLKEIKTRMKRGETQKK